MLTVNMVSLVILDLLVRVLQAQECRNLPLDLLVLVLLAPQVLMRPPKANKPLGVETLTLIMLTTGTVRPRDDFWVLGHLLIPCPRANQVIMVKPRLVLKEMLPKHPK